MLAVGVGGCQGHPHIPISISFDTREKLKLFSFPDNALLQFVLVCVCLAPLVPRLTPWIVAVAVVILALGFLTIGSIFFTWRLYKERFREQKSEFGSKGKSWCPQGFLSKFPEKWDSGLFQQENEGS